MGGGVQGVVEPGYKTSALPRDYVFTAVETISEMLDLLLKREERVDSAQFITGKQPPLLTSLSTSVVQMRRSWVKV